MEKQIRIVWLLSLVSAFLATGVQGYWLYNQYAYVVDSYSQELAEKILEAGEREFEIRRTKVNATTSYIIRKQTTHGNSDSLQSFRTQAIQLSMNLYDTTTSAFLEKYKWDPRISEEELNAEFDRAATDRILHDTMTSLFLKKYKWDSGISGEELNAGLDRAVANRILHDTVTPVLLKKYKWDSRISEEELSAGLDRAVTDGIYPFRQELLDSLLAEELPDLRYTVSPWYGEDSVHYVSHWERKDRLLRPQLTVCYAYSPLEKKGAVIRTFIPVQPVFRRMAMQWALACGLILLLAACFVFQIKTILKQKKTGELREHFVNTMVHELKRPVQTLKTFVSFLGDREMRSDERATEQVVQDAMFELDNLSVYLNKLKDMLRADSESTALNRTRFDLSALIGKVVRLTPVPAGKTVRFSTSCEMGESAPVEADPVHIANVLNNLIENAVKYSGPEVDIEVKASRKGKGISLTVSDNGIGIPAAEQDKVFAKFYRGANLPEKDIPGLGLGLSYVELIAKAHQGDVVLSSRPGKGTSVTLFIPQ
jgi:two-component system phosphate regulon sensor histidine kinase PhoR